MPLRLASLRMSIFWSRSSSQPYWTGVAEERDETVRSKDLEMD